MPECLLGIDAGTTACKTVLFDLKGNVIAKASQEYPVIYPRPTWAEQDPDSWWKAVIDTIQTVIKRADLNGDEILGIGIDSQREAVVPIDSKGEKLWNSIIWLDRRTLTQAENIKKMMPVDYVVETTGVPIDYFYSAAKILWMKEEVPEVFNKVWKLLFPKDYIIYKLTGETITDYSMASRTMLFDLNQLRWSDDICSKLQISLESLPDIKTSWEAVGEVTGETAKLTGLKKGIPVAGGGGDRPCEALGAGVIDPGYINIGTGTGTVITTPLSKPIVDKMARIDCCCHVVPDRWEYEVVILTTGASLKWFRDTFCSEEIVEARERGIDPYFLLDRLAESVSMGSGNLFYYPYPMGAKAPKFNNLAKAIFYGFTLGHTKSHFVRAILEGVAFQYAESIEILSGLGVSVKEASIVGGESQSDLWNQIKADVIGRPIKTLQVPDAAALGTAILGGMSAKTFGSIHKAVEEMVRIKRVYTPNRERNLQYSKILLKYKRIYESVERGFEVIK